LQDAIDRARNDPPDPAAYDEWLDRVSQIMEGRDQDGPIDDQDLQAAGLPVG
jgi:hypothetical protein